MLLLSVVLKVNQHHTSQFKILENAFISFSAENDTIWSQTK